MRGVVRLFVLAVMASAGGACTAEIAPETYFCGPEKLCPEGLACNDADNICTVPTAVEPFGCGEIDGVEIPDRPGDDSPADGFDISSASSCTANRELRACLFQDDPGDWVQFDIPAMCGGNLTLSGRITFAVAFEPIAIQLVTDDGPAATIDVECASTSTAAGQTQRCFEVTVAGDAHHALGLVHSDTANCDGACAHNRYLLDLRLEP